MRTCNQCENEHTIKANVCGLSQNLAPTDNRGQAIEASRRQVAVAAIAVQAIEASRWQVGFAAIAVQAIEASRRRSPIAAIAAIAAIQIAVDVIGCVLSCR